MEAARLRLRPILMTAFAFILGVVPLMVATGAGAASRQSIGTTVFGGMLAATILTLIFVPVFYAVIEQLAGAPHSARHPVAAHRRKQPNRPAGGIRTELSHANWKVRSRLSDRDSAAAAAAAVIVALRPAASRQDGCGDAATPPMMAMPVPVTKVVKQIGPDLPRLFGAHRSDPQHRAAGQGQSGYVQRAARARRCRRKGRRSPLQDRFARLSGGARSGQGAGGARRGRRSSYCAGQSRPRRRRSRRAASSPRTPSSSAASAVAPGRGGRGHGRGGGPHGASSTSVTREIRAPFAGRLGRNQAPVGTLISAAGSAAEHAGAARARSTSPSIRARRIWRRSRRRASPARSRRKSCVPGDSRTHATRAS